MCGHPAGRYHIIHHLIKEAYRKEEKWMVGHTFKRVIIIGCERQVGGTFWAWTPLHWWTAAAASDGNWSQGLCTVRCSSQSKPWLPLSKLASRLKLSPKATRDTCNLSPLWNNILHLNCHLEAEEFVFLLGMTLNTNSVFLTKHCIIKNPPPPTHISPNSFGRSRGRF